MQYDARISQRCFHFLTYQLTQSLISRFLQLRMPFNFNPCCRIPLQKGVRILAIINAVHQTFSCITVVVIAFILIANPEAARKKTPRPITDQEVTIAIIALFIAAILTAIEAFLAIKMFIGAGKRNIAPCRSWMKYKIGLLVFSLIGMIVNAASPSSSMKMNSIAYSEYTTSTVSQVINVLWDVYMIVCVAVFIEELKHEQPGERRTLLMVSPTATPTPYVKDGASASTSVSVLPEGGVKPPSPRSNSPSNQPNSEA